MSRITVPLDQAELEALVRMADEACRPPRLQLRHILREEATRRGLLSPDTQSTPAQTAHTQGQEGR